jgi:hypothetical protein
MNLLLVCRDPDHRFERVFDGANHLDFLILFPKPGHFAIPLWVWDFFIRKIDEKY